MNIQWKSSADLSAINAAWCLNHWPTSCRKCSDNLYQSAIAISAAAELMNVSLNRFWETLLTVAVDTPSTRDLADRVMVRLVPAAARTEVRMSQLASSLATFKSGYLREFPDFNASMRLRIEPLKQQWEAYGPGLLVLIGNLTDQSIIASQAEVVLVEPFGGGGGFPHLSTNRCHIEAVLTNVDPQLSETLRLAWLLSQLEFERPIYSDLINAFRLSLIARLAMLPPILLAGEELGLCAYSAVSMERAILLWRVVAPSVSPAAMVQVVMTWWDTVKASEPEWRIALTGLDRMLG